MIDYPSFPSSFGKRHTKGSSFGFRIDVRAKKNQLSDSSSLRPRYIPFIHVIFEMDLVAAIFTLHNYSFFYFMVSIHDFKFDDYL